MLRANLIKINDKTQHLKKGIYCCALELLWLTWRSPRKPFPPQHPSCGSRFPAGGKDSQAWKFCCCSRCDHPSAVLPHFCIFFYLPVVQLAFERDTRPALQQQSCSSLSLNSSPSVPLHFLSFCTALSRNADEEGEGWLLRTILLLL